MPETSSPLRLDLRHAIVALVVGALVGGLLAVAVGRRHETYESRAVLAIDQPLAIAASGSGGIVEKLSRLRGKYAGLVRTDVIAEPVAEHTGQSVGAVRGSLLAAADDTSLLLVVGARTPDPARSKRLASAAADEVVAYAAAEQERYSIPKAQQFTFQVVVPAGNAASVTPQRSRQLRVGFLGLLVGAGLVYATLELLATERRR
ncbi:MAG: hypothetical protein JWN67_1968 [Actinomycetia bacterium]|nr:hypothetical protein [Actinomycetes bacterium]